MKKYFAIAGLCLLWNAAAAEELPIDAATAMDENAPAATETSPGIAGDVAALLAEGERYREATEDFQKAVNRTVYYSYQKKVRAIAIEQEAKFAIREAELRVQREQTIQVFENFIERYPHKDVYTPDALFRLADLYFDRSDDNYNLALEQQLRAQEAAGDVELEQDEIVKDYSPTIETFDRLIREWPNYEQIDGAYYLSGYCLLGMNREQDARDKFVELIELFPTSQYIPESWMRLGEYSFENAKFQDAATAYEHALEYPESSVYATALYKLAWTYYVLDRYPDAIAGFHRLLQYGEAQQKAGKGGLDTREEAIQYLAIAIQEEDWDADGMPDPDAGLPRIKKYITGTYDYEMDVLLKLADILFDTGKYEEDIATIRFIQSKYPNDPHNPVLHEKMFNAYARLQRFDEIVAERESLLNIYGEGTAWREANHEDQELLEKTDRFLEETLATTAVYLHQRAQSMRSQMTEEETIAAYEHASACYANYLSRYATSENAYDFRMNYAETLYYSFHFEQAAEQYILVRDWESENKYKESAAYSAIIARENLIRDQINQGLMASRPTYFDQPWQAPEVETGETDENGQPILAVIPEDPIPQLAEELLEVRESYVNLGLSSPDDPRRKTLITFKIGEVYLSYNHYNEARAWFERIIRESPNDDLARDAANLGFETYRLSQNWQGMSAWSSLMDEAGIGDEEFKGEIRILKAGATFRSAELLFKAEKYEEAAGEYLRLLEDDPENEYADRALMNAGLAYVQTRRYESAARMFRRVYLEHPKSPRAPEALYQVGLQAEKFYDYDLAVQSYLTLVNQYKESPRRADALYRAAELLEFNQDYQKAAANYERYAELFPDRADTAETYYRSADVYKKLDRPSEELRICETYIKRYGKNIVHASAEMSRDPNELMIEVLARTSKLQRKLGQSKGAARTRQQVIEEFQRRGLPAGSVAAQYPAEALFMQIDEDFQMFSKTRLDGSLDKQGRTIQKMLKQVPEFNRRYAEVMLYKSPHWILAASYRKGHLNQRFAEILYDAEIPSNFDADTEDEYRTQLEDVASPIEDAALAQYQQVLDTAREHKLVDEWTALSLQALHKYNPKDYPLFKEEHSLQTTRLLTPSRFADPPAVVVEDGERTASEDGALESETTASIETASKAAEPKNTAAPSEEPAQVEPAAPQTEESGQDTLPVEIPSAVGAAEDEFSDDFLIPVDLDIASPEVQP